MGVGVRGCAWVGVRVCVGGGERERQYDQAHEIQREHVGIWVKDTMCSLSSSRNVSVRLELTQNTSKCNSVSSSGGSFTLLVLFF